MGQNKSLIPAPFSDNDLYRLAQLQPSPEVSSAGRENEVRRYWRILTTHRVVLLACVVGMITVATILSLLIPPQYEAVGRVAVGREASDSLGFKTFGQSNLDDSDVMMLDTQVNIVQSDTLALQTLKKLNLSNHPEFKAEPSFSWLHASQPPKQSALITRFKQHLDVARMPHSRMIEIRFSSSDPQLAAQVVDTLANVYVEQNYRAKYESTIETSNWLEKQLSDLKRNVEVAEQKLVTYQKAHGIIGLDEKQNIVTSKLDQLNKDLISAQTARIEKESKYRLALSRDPELLYKADPTSLLPKLRADEAELRAKYAEAGTNMGPRHPRVLELKNQLEEVETNIRHEISRISAGFEAEYMAAAKHEKMLSAAMEQQKAAANKLNESGIEYNLLKRDADTSRQLYENLLTKVKEAGVSAGLRSAEIRVIDYAQVPSRPVRPRPLLYLGFGLLAGICSGVGAAFLLDKVDNTVHSPNDVELLSQMQPLATIPRIALTADRSLRVHNRITQLMPAATAASPVELISLLRPRSSMAESYRALRTSILLSAAGAPPRIMLVTSALPQEGKTTTSMNLAIVLAQTGGRVLLIEADMRRPKMDEVLGLTSDEGLSTVLSRTTTMNQAAFCGCAGLENLSILVAGPRLGSDCPAESLGSTAMRGLLGDARHEFDFVVLDTPPALVVTDAIVLSPLADTVILVARTGHTPSDALVRLRNLLDTVRASVAGVVVNAADLGSSALPRFNPNYYE